MKTIINIFLILILSVCLSIEINLIGGNIEGIADFSKSHCYCDMVKQSRQFGLPGKTMYINIKYFP